jgi:hypothetical protein
MYGHDYSGYGKKYKPFKERGGCLTIWLIWLILSSALGLLRSFGPRPEISEAMRAFVDVPNWFYTLGAFTSLLTVACGIGLWLWKRWGWYGLVARAAIGVVASLALGALWVVAVLFGEGISLGITWMLIQPVWEDFE